MAFVMTGYCYLACWIFVDNPQALLKRSPHTTYLQSLTNLQWRSGFRGSWLIWVAWNCASRPLGSKNALALQHAPALVLHTKAVHVLLSSPPQLPGKCSGMDIAPRLTGFISRTFRLLSDCLALWNFQRWADLAVQRWPWNISVLLTCENRVVSWLLVVVRSLLLDWCSSHPKDMLVFVKVHRAEDIINSF